MGVHVLVTGAAGYLGSILCEHLLDEGHTVTALDNLTCGQTSLFHLCANPRFDFVFGDVRDKNVMCSVLQKADVIINLAAVVGAPACSRDPYLTKSVNLEAVRQLNSLRSPSQLIIQPTTNSGYGTQSGEVFCTEETPLQPISLYGQTKVEAEAELLSSSNTISLRLATVFGVSPRMRIDLLVNHFVYAAVTDGYLILFEKDFKRNFVHIRDVADCFAFCIQNAPAMAGQPYNVGLDEANLSKGELAQKVKDQVPKLFLHFSELGTDPDKRNYIVSSARLHAAGFRPHRTLEAGIQELIKAYKMLPRSPYKNV